MPIRSLGYRNIAAANLSYTTACVGGRVVRGGRRRGRVHAQRGVVRSTPDKGRPRCRIVYCQTQFNRVQGIRKTRVVALFLLLPILRDCDHPDVGVPIYTVDRLLAALPLFPSLTLVRNSSTMS